MSPRRSAAASKNIKPSSPSADDDSKDWSDDDRAPPRMPRASTTKYVNHLYDYSARTIVSKKRASPPKALGSDFFKDLTRKDEFLTDNTNGVEWIDYEFEPRREPYYYSAYSYAEDNAEFNGEFEDEPPLLDHQDKSGAPADKAVEEQTQSGEAMVAPDKAQRHVYI